ncbi:MAG: zinc-finger domain-containing protein [Rhodospirillales bacterium]
MGIIGAAGRAVPAFPEKPRTIMQDLATTTTPEAPAAAGDYDETIFVDSRVVGCDGGGGPLGHPLVYLKIGAPGDIVCPYCSRHFVHTGADGAGDDH